MKDTTNSISDLLPGSLRSQDSKASPETEEVRRYPDRRGDVTIRVDYHFDFRNDPPIVIDQIRSDYGTPESDDTGGASPGNAQIEGRPEPENSTRKSHGENQK